MANLVAFIDGTVIKTARPGGSDIFHCVAYNEHQHKHALSYQNGYHFGWNLCSFTRSRSGKAV